MLWSFYYTCSLFFFFSICYVCGKLMKWNTTHSGILFPIPWSIGRIDISSSPSNWFFVLDCRPRHSSNISETRDVGTLGEADSVFPSPELPPSPSRIEASLCTSCVHLRLQVVQSGGLVPLCSLYRNCWWEFSRQPRQLILCVYTKRSYSTDLLSWMNTKFLLCFFFWDERTSWFNRSIIHYCCITWTEIQPEAYKIENILQQGVDEEKLIKLRDY